MKIYTIECSEIFEFFVFANSFDEAAEIFTTWAAINERMPEQFSIGRWRASSARARAQLRKALLLETTGIGLYDLEIGWTIKLPTDEIDL